LGVVAASRQLKQTAVRLDLVASRQPAVAHENVTRFTLPSTSQSVPEDKKSQPKIDIILGDWDAPPTVASVAQLVEQLTLNQLVHGSSPCRGTIFS
jgi:hypothetical protein